MLIYFLIPIFFILYSYLCWKNIKTGIYFIVLLLPTYLIRFNIGIPFTMLEGMIWLLFIIWLIKLFKEGGRLNFNIFKPALNNPLPKTFRWPIILFFVAATISAIISPNTTGAFGIWKAYFLEPLLFFVILIYNLKDLKDLKKLLYCLEALVIVIGVFALVQKITGVLIPNPFWQDEATRRVTTFFGYPNANGLLIAPIIMLIIGNLLTDKKFWLQVLNLGSLVFGVLTIIWAQTEGAILGLIAGFLFLLLSYKFTRKITLVTVAIFIILLLITSNISFNKIKLPNPDLNLQSSSLDIRVNMWSETLNMLKTRPIFGGGLANYQDAVAPYHKYSFVEIYLYPHNIFLNFWSETGLLGLIAFIWLIIAFFNYGWKKFKELGRPLLLLTIIGSMVVLFIHGLFDVPYFKNDLAVLFWIIVALPIIFVNINTGLPPARE